jgi:signal transduction histidine kinase
LEAQTAALQRTETELMIHAQALKKSNQELAVALEVAREASQAKSRFLASVSHELRTPLNGIIGFSELLHDGKLGPVSADQKEYLADVLSCSNHLLTLINHVLDLTKIEAGKMEFHYQPVLLAENMAEAVDSMKAIAATKRLNVRPEDEYHYRIAVEDNGIGIHTADLPRLFSEFGQLGASEKAQAGTGLGLVITKRIVEAQGGSVGVESVFGKGSRFYAILPCEPE